MSSENEDSLGNTMLGTEIKERFHSMRTAFLKLDKDRDGRLTVAEIRKMCKEWNIPMSEADRVLDCADINENGTLDFNEFAQRFDPDCGNVSAPISPTASSTAYGATYKSRDERPIGGSGSYHFEDYEVTDEKTKSAVKLQSMERGRSTRANMTPRKKKTASKMPEPLDTGGPGPCTSPKNVSTPVGSGAAAVRGITQNSLSARVEELENELAASRAREEKLQARVAELEAELEAVGSTGRGIDGGGMTGDGMSGGETTQKPESDSLLVYGRSNCKATAAVKKELTKNGIEFETRDMDKDQSYREILKASGFSGGKAPPPVVCYRGQAWWDEPDGAVAVHFPSMLVNEMRKLGMGPVQDDVPAVTRDVSMDTEIGERFQSMQEAFLKVDANRDGRITKAELRKMCQNWNIPTSEAERIMGEADIINVNGTLDFNEFVKRFRYCVNG